jgi:hypothetical protein
MSNVAKTSKGSLLPMIKLKGKDYLLVAHRLLWLNDDFENFTVTTDIVQLTDTYAVVRATVVIFDKATGMTIRSSTATKRETQKDFPDFLEKAETGSIGRALAMIGIGTQFAQQDMEEGTRLADAPLEAPKAEKKSPIANKREAVTAKAVLETAKAMEDVVSTLATANAAQEMNVVEADTVPEKLDLSKAKAGSFRRDRKAASVTSEETAVKPAAATSNGSNGASKGWR